MRKTIVLAIATTFLAVVTVATGMVRAASGPFTVTNSASPVVHPQATGSLAVRLSKAS